MAKENPIHKQQIDPVPMADRFPYYDLDGRLASNAAEIHSIIAGREEAVAAAYWSAFNALPTVDRKVEGDLLESYIRGSARHTVAKYADAAGQEVATIACQNAHMARRVKLPLASVMSCIAESQRLTIEYVVEACFGDAERLARLMSAVNRLALLEFDIMHRYAKKLDRAVISSERQTLAGDFDRSIASLVQDTDGVREQLAKQAASADMAAKGMIAKTSEVAAASEQSAMAMREAASTAAGLIRAIEDARSTAIQQATRGSVSANQSIQATIVEVQTSAQRIRDAMDAQAQTVTSITAAVDETALAADSMSSTIASIRNDSGMVASEISVLSQEFAKMGGRLQQLEQAASEFSRRVA
ncbi:MAG: chemotaxis protein [Sphingomonadales bacterium]|nr:MAG: chemotaxis protein [Sphingomonadales bacterium]